MMRLYPLWAGCKTSIHALANLIASNNIITISVKQRIYHATVRCSKIIGVSRKNSPPPHPFFVYPASKPSTMIHKQNPDNNNPNHHRLFTVCLLFMFGTVFHHTYVRVYVLIS